MELDSQQLVVVLEELYRHVPALELVVAVPLAQFQEPHYPSDQEVRVEVYEVAVDADADPVAAQAFVDQLVAAGKTRTNPRLII